MNKSSLRILSTLEHVGGFASAQEIHRIMTRDGKNIGLTTIYRGLQALVGEKVVDILRRDDGEAIYRMCGVAHHHHLVCKNCGRTVEIEGEVIEKWAAREAAANGFREVGHSAEIFGICSSC
ncbi:MAG: transcriptional repressor [Actinobacteria bacterium]|nr:transcriptional repressor [Actinomycetota bacterium]